jgi:23S rRNA-/tRNA-specific pseudouridylate synthase
LGEPCVVAAASQKTLAVSLLSVRPITGRKHQIRIHSSHYGYPLLGDVRYGGPTRLTQPNGSVLSVKRVMLHAYRLVIPWEREPWSITCAPPRDFEGLWTSLGGDPAHLHLPLPA